MRSFNHAATGVVVLAAALTAVAGCSGNTALVGRDTLPGRASQAARSEMLRTVERIDTGSSEIHLRSSPGQPGMVTYSGETRVMYLSRVYPVSQLRVGDVIALQMEKNSRGQPHTHSIRLEKSAGDWAQR